MDARWHDAACGRLREIREDEAFRGILPLRELVRELLERDGGNRERRMLAGWGAYLGGAASAQPERRRVLTDLASRPLTVARLLDDLGVGAGGAVRVHVMAASAKELESLELYEELARFWPESEFDVALIGPELPSIPLGGIPRVRVSLHTTEYTRGMWCQIGRPDLIVGFDAGLLLYRAWGKTMPELFGSGVPFAITSYRAWEARAEAEVLHRQGALCVSPPQANPFASQASRRSTTIANDVSRDNSYLSVWR